MCVGVFSCLYFITDYLAVRILLLLKSNYYQPCNKSKKLWSSLTNGYIYHYYGDEW